MQFSRLFRTFGFYLRDFPSSVLKEFAPKDAPTFARALDLGIAPD